MKVEKAYSSVRDFLTKVINDFGDEDPYTHVKSLFVFNYCSDLGLSLDESTIDVIREDDGFIEFVYNNNEQPEPDYDILQAFDINELYDFCKGIKEGIEDEKECKIEADFED